MKSLLGQGESKRSRTSDPHSYSVVAGEYYDEALHPTCADFRAASHIYLAALFERARPLGRIADIGCGESLLVGLGANDLVLIDSSECMLARNPSGLEKRQVDVVADAFGTSEFDWVFAVLADPYNGSAVWRHIERALKINGRCVFIVPSHRWVTTFRRDDRGERVGFARFDLTNGSTVFLPSFVLSEDEQFRVIREAGLEAERIEHVYISQMDKIRSPKIKGVLGELDPILDIYWVRKTKEND
jgi:hypothetical protein